jgi:hypothetical protein
VTDNQLSLQKFIEQTLDEICGAVENTRNKRPYVAPANSPYAGDSTKSTLVDFDIAISVTESDEQSENKQGGFKISVLMNSLKTGMDLDKKEASGSTNSTVTKVKFSVPVYFQFSEEALKRAQERSKPVRRANSHMQGGHW